MSRIPTKLKVVVNVNSNEADCQIGLTKKTIKCHPAWVTDADGNQNTLKRAITWAQRGGGGHKVIEIDNEPFKDPTLVGIETRGEGAQVYKVVTPQGWLVDMRDDVFESVLLRKGLPRHMGIPGKFVWAMNVTQMRLVEVGSRLHKEIVGHQAAKAAPKSKKVKLVVGGVYGNSNSTNVYLGRVRHKGKLKYAWLCLHAGRVGTRDPYQRFYKLALKRRLSADGRMADGGLTAVITGSHSYIEQYDTVEMGDNWQSHYTDFRKGHSYGAEITDVEWA